MNFRKEKMEELEKGLKFIDGDLDIFRYFSNAEEFLVKEGLSDIQLSLLKEFIKEYRMFEFNLDLAKKMFFDEDYRNALFYQSFNFENPILTEEYMIKFIKEKFKVGKKVPEFIDDNETHQLFKKIFKSFYETKDGVITKIRTDLEDLTEEEKEVIMRKFFINLNN